MVERVTAPPPLEPERSVTERVIERFPPIERRNGAVMLVLPGGGYAQHTKGDVWSEWLVRHGFCAFELRYTLEPRSVLGRACSVGPALEDAKAALVHVRQRAVELGVSSTSLGIMASSAGAHLSMCLCHSLSDAEKPVACVLLYPPVRNPLCTCMVGSLRLFPRAVDASVTWNWWMDESGEHQWCQLLLHASDQPPTFLVASAGDTLLPPSKHADLLADALMAEAVEVEYYKGDYGDHGFGLGAPWPQKECMKWLCGKVDVVCHHTEEYRGTAELEERKGSGICWLS